MVIDEIQPRHHAALLALNAEFVHWLSPLDTDGLDYLLDRTSYARQIDNGAGVLIGYPHNVDYPDHKHLSWLRRHLDDFFYIDRIIIAARGQGRGHGRALYEDIAAFARARGHSHLACEVNTVPDNPGSHRFHTRAGFTAVGEQDYPAYGTSVRYYAKAL